MRDVIKLLQEGKPLPDEYRFKLFDSDREVELVWNGKTNEVESAVLPFQYIEHIDEPRSEEDTKAQTELLNFSGKKTADWTNKLIWGDNKYILSSLKKWKGAKYAQLIFKLILFITFSILYYVKK